MTSERARVVVLAGVAMLAWASVFADTYQYSFHSDDYHFIRSYSGAELLSTFHGMNDPDGFETPALRPFATMLFHIQGTLFGEDVVLQRVFVSIWMFGFFVALGWLLSTVGLTVPVVALTFALIVVSRAFASVLTWLTLGSLVVSHTCLVLCALFFLLWMKRERIRHLVLSLVFAGTAVLIREDAYVLPAVLPLVWLLSAGDPFQRRHMRPLVTALAAITTINAIHFYLRRLFIPDAPPIHLSLDGGLTVLRSAFASCLPMGLEAQGPWDFALLYVWTGFLLLVAFLLVWLGGRRLVIRGCVGTCAIGVLLCAPALGIARAFGILLPTAAFMTALAMALNEVFQLLRSGAYSPRARGVAIAALTLGVLVGLLGGLQRSRHLADAFHPNSVTKVSRDADFLIGHFAGRATIPDVLETRLRLRLAELGIRSAEDLRRLQEDFKANPDPYIANRATKSPLFLPKYHYLAF